MERASSRTRLVLMLALGFAAGYATARHRTRTAPAAPPRPSLLDRLREVQAYALPADARRREGPHRGEAAPRAPRDEEGWRRLIAQAPFHLIEQAFNERNDRFWETRIRPLFPRHPDEAELREFTAEAGQALEEAALGSDHWTAQLDLALPSGTWDFRVLLKLYASTRRMSGDSARDTGSFCFDVEGWVEGQPDTRFGQSSCVESLIRRGDAYYALLNLTGAIVRPYVSHLEVRLPFAGATAAEARVIGPDRAGGEWQELPPGRWAPIGADEAQQLRREADR
jgi:hypothetical protein